MKLKRLLIASALSVAALGAHAKDVVDTAAAAGNFKTLAAALKAMDLRSGEVKTVQGSTVMISTLGGAMVNDAKVVGADVAADNGVIHAIDTVLMPR
ncbi:MAG: fasciclin domain-containing protein [Rhodoferax sp.]|nr:fasciclin domain-containing protein [Rhodoferax sp.]